MANRIGLEFKGFTDALEELDKAGGDLKRATEAALKSSKQAVNPGIQKAIAKHRRTGRTQASLDTNMSVTWEGTTASVDIGFHVRDGGLPSIFLMYGTPRTAPDKQLYNSIYGKKVREEVAEIQEEAIGKVMSRAMGGT